MTPSRGTGGLPGDVPPGELPHSRVPPGDAPPGEVPPDELRPGEVLYGEGDIGLNAGRPVTRLIAVNAADRPVQVGSHYHFAEANPGLEFDRAAAYGLRLNIPAGTAVRFEPGIPVEIELIPIGGRREVAGLRGETGGPLDA